VVDAYRQLLNHPKGSDLHVHIRHRCPGVASLSNILLSSLVYLTGEGTYACARLCKQAQWSSWLSTTTTTVTTPRPFRAHHTTALAMPLRSPRVRLQGHAPRTPVCWLMGKVWSQWSGPGLGEPTDSLTAHARPALSTPIGGPSLVSPRLSSSLLVSLTSARGYCPLPSAHCPLPRPFPTAVASWARPGLASLMLRESPQPVPAKGCPRLLAG
jgi:hypothetical protein